MKYIKTTFLAALIFSSFSLAAQLQVSKEPRHKNVFENKYVRLLDVHIQPADTSLFHIHSIPSVFVHFTNTVVCSQLKGKEWEKGKNTKGDAEFVSFVDNMRVHRVSNCDTVPFHVMDAELLSSYNAFNKNTALPFAIIIDNEKIIAYRLTKNGFTTQAISKRGPMIAELVSGSNVYYVDKNTRQKKEIKEGGYLYIEPDALFYFDFKGKEKLNLVLIEIK